MVPPSFSSQVSSHGQHWRGCTVFMCSSLICASDRNVWSEGPVCTRLLRSITIVYINTENPLSSWAHSIPAHLHIPRKLREHIILFICQCDWCVHHLSVGYSNATFYWASKFSRRKKLFQISSYCGSLYLKVIQDKCEWARDGAAVIDNTDNRLWSKEWGRCADGVYV